jgi:hypothetical protein
MKRNSKMRIYLIAFLVVFVTPVAAQNLLINPDFDLDPTNPANGWSVEGTGVFLWNQSDGQPSPPSARTNQFAGESMTLYQCVGIASSTNYDFSSRSFTHASIGTGTNGVRLSVYASNDCSGAALETAPTDQLSFPDWALRERNAYLAPPTANSARIELFSTGNSDSNQISWDNVMLVGQGPPVVPPEQALPVPTLANWALMTLFALLGIMVIVNRRRLF